MASHELLAFWRLHQLGHLNPDEMFSPSIAEAHGYSALLTRFSTPALQPSTTPAFLGFIVAKPHH